MKDSEVIELDSKVFPTSQPPPSYPVQAETDTPKSESKSICHENYKLTLYFLVWVDPARMVAIPVEDFKQHCIDYHKSRDAGFEEEYEVYLYLYDFCPLVSLSVTTFSLCHSPWLLVHSQFTKCHRCSATSRRTDLQTFIHVSQYHPLLVYYSYKVMLQTMILELCWKRFLGF